MSSLFVCGKLMLMESFTKKGDSPHGQKRADLQARRNQSLQNPSQPKVHSQPKKRGGQRTHATPGQKEKTLVLIEWVDSFGCSPSWQRIDGLEAVKPMRCQSVGWLLYQDEQCLVVVPHLSTDQHESIEPQGCGDMTIPRRAILSITSLALSR